LEQKTLSEEEIISIFQQIKEAVSFLKDNEISLEEETSYRDLIIEATKHLITNKGVDTAQKRILQIILTKLYSWNPFLKDFMGVGDLPVLIGQIFNTIDILISTDEIQEISIKYFKDDGEECIDEDSPIAITLKDALDIIDKFPTLEEYKGNLIGFFNDKGAGVNFIRREKNVWLLDIPPQEGDDEFYVSLSDDTLSNESVKELMDSFFTNIDVMKDLRKKLELTDIIKQILNYEIESKDISNIDVVSTALNILPGDTEDYLALLNNSTTYEEHELPFLKQKAKYAFEKLLEPNLYEFIVNLGMDFYTAKKVGKYLLDIGWINEFHRIPITDE